LAASHAFESANRRKLVGRVLLGVAALFAVLGFMGAFQPHYH
jgi:hypothetical protein